MDTHPFIPQRQERFGLWDPARCGYTTPCGYGGTLQCNQLAENYLFHWEPRKEEKMQHPMSVETLAAMDRVREEYSIDEWGIIRSPGKFEAEAWYAPIVYDWYLDGDAGEMVGDTSIYVLEPAERERFGFGDWGFAVTLSENDQGFVYVSTLDRAEYEKMIEEAAEEEEAEDD